MVKTGLDHIAEKQFENLKGKNVALLCNQASIASDIRHMITIFREAHDKGILSLKALLGPQHGLWGHTQDNMIEWEADGQSDAQIPVYSLYGRHRQPTREMLQDVDVLVIDLQDVGAKYYTFIWSMAHCMEVCANWGIRVVVLDRPNPINGATTEGPAENNGFLSFVGVHPLGIRHALTIGEIALLLQEQHYPQCELEVVKMSGWERSMYFEDTGLPWAVPSPNIPIPESTVVYPGMCLLEATNLSEGRGTTRPFEFFGAPWIDGWQLAEKLADLNLPGIVFRPVEFEPTFQKHAETLCGGCFMHVTDRSTFLPFLTTVALLREIRHDGSDKFAWNDPPYEYEYEKMPFDILAGNDWLRQMIDDRAELSEMQARWEKEQEAFTPMRKRALLY